MERKVNRDGHDARSNRERSHRGAQMLAGAGRRARNRHRHGHAPVRNASASTAGRNSVPKLAEGVPKLAARGGSMNLMNGCSPERPLTVGDSLSRTEGSGTRTIALDSVFTYLSLRCLTYGLLRPLGLITAPHGVDSAPDGGKGTWPPLIAPDNDRGVCARSATGRRRSTHPKCSRIRDQR